MTVAELRRELEALPDDAVVVLDVRKVNERSAERYPLALPVLVAGSEDGRNAVLLGEVL